MTGAPSREDAQSLLIACVEACDVLQPLVRALYDSLAGDSATLKADASVFTIADGLVQQLLKSHFLAGKVGAVVGEEDSADIHVAAPPYKVDHLAVPERYNDAIALARTSLDAIRLSRLPALAQLTAFIDPIDGTREFSTKLGEQCSICIGFALDARAWAGIVYRPLTTPPTFAAGCVADRLVFSRLDMAPQPSTGLLTSNGGISPYLESLMAELQCPRVKSGGCGNKMLMLLERKGASYIQDRGISRWDTCAAEAVLIAHGGALVKLSPLLAADAAVSLEPYTYRKSTHNLDFVPNLAALTPYNATVKVDGKAPAVMAARVEDVKAYSNLCGIFAIRDATEVEQWRAACVAASKKASPEFN
jgi:3'-phosphoadenosine 5'-phosphosulfate (PAPS) 3'-phosphatase